MKKKIIIVFLICCMLFGVVSPALAAGLYPDPPTNDAMHYCNIIMFPSGSNVNDPVTYPYLCMYTSFVDEPDESVNRPVYVELDEENYICAVYFPLPSSITADSLSNLNVNNTFSMRYWNTTSVKWSNLSSNALKQFEYVNGYVRIDTFNTPNGLLSFDSYNSNTDILIYGTDENFPPAPPLVNLTEELIQKTPEALDLDGKMMILVPFGISCLALLISLPLLLKVLRRFLG